MVHITRIIALALKNVLIMALHLAPTGNFPKALSKVEEARVIEKMTNGDEAEAEEARKTLISHNLRLISYLVKRYYSDHKDAEDLISIGMIGLVKAARSFDGTRDASFGTYASRCIHNEIRMYFRKTNNQSKEVSINQPLGIDQQGNELTNEQLIDSRIDVPLDAQYLIERKQLYKIINENLEPREQEILCLRNGLLMKRGGIISAVALKQKDVASLLGISRSYVSRIEKRAMDKIHQAWQA